MKKNIFIITVVILVMDSCIYVDMNHFNRDDKEWLSPYNEGDTVLFSSLFHSELNFYFARIGLNLY